MIGGMLSVPTGRDFFSLWRYDATTLIFKRGALTACFGAELVTGITLMATTFSDAAEHVSQSE